MWNNHIGMGQLIYGNGVKKILSKPMLGMQLFKRNLQWWLVLTLLPNLRLG